MNMLGKIRYEIMNLSLCPDVIPLFYQLHRHELELLGYAL